MARMRLRQRTPRSLPADWVQPRWSGRWTTIGNLDGRCRGGVDPAGLVTVDGQAWSLDWWIGAEDRWHIPAEEVSVRQSLVSASPVVETRVRVPSGDAVQRAFAARAVDGTEAIVVEVENQSKVPVAVAFAVRPHTQVGVGRVGSIELDGEWLRVDGRPAVLLPRSPGRVAFADAASGDSARAMFDGQAVEATSMAVRCGDELAQGAVLFPLAHTATLRVVLPLGTGAPRIAALPAAAQVASGWSRLAGSAMRIEVPDRRVRDAMSASTRHLLLGAQAPPGAGAVDPDVVAALDLLGFSAEVRRILTADPVVLTDVGRPGAMLDAVVGHWELTRDVEVARATVELVAALVRRLPAADPGDAARGRRCLAGAVHLLAAAGERRASDDVLAILSADEDHGQVPVGSDPGELAALLASASGTWTWASGAQGHDLGRNAELVGLVRRQLVQEAGARKLALSPVVPEAWLGQGWEVHDAPTAHGQLSYAIRWHGDRPALLWELVAHDGDVVTLTAPGLDPSWSTDDPTGEALLAPVQVPQRSPRRGLTIPVSIEPLRREPS